MYEFLLGDLVIAVLSLTRTMQLATFKAVHLENSTRDDELAQRSLYEL